MNSTRHQSTGTVMSLGGTAQDVTQAEAALRRNEAVQRAIISNISDVIAIIDRNGINRFKSVNIEKWFGWQPEEVVGAAALDNVHPEDRERLSSQFAALLGRPGAAGSGECRYRCKDGTYKWIELNAVNLLQDPDIDGVLLNYHDISERRRTQLALRESEARHRTLFQSSRDALMILAPPSWQFCSGNPAAVALLGARDEWDFVSRAPWEYSPDRQPDGRDSKEKAMAMIESAMREGTLFFEWTHRRATGEDFPATVLLTRIELNGISMLQATVRDESERKRLQASMAQADRLASMGMLAAGVAHEINNPLAYVRYNIESLAQDIPKLADALQLAAAMIKSQLGDSSYASICGADANLLEPASLLDTVERTKESLEGIERIVAITRGLSTFSRVEQANRNKVDVSVAIEVAINMAHNELSHRARLVKDIGPMPRVLASEGKLSQVFLNLLVNAAHAIDEGNVPNNQISVRAWTERDHVCIEVTDTGKGIAPENLQKIFEPFYTTKGVGLGSGLGLSISRNILSEFNGSLSVTSKLGTGSSFLVRLPVMSEPLPESRNVAVDTLPDNEVRRGRILVVEDEAAINKSLVRLFGQEHQVVSVASGKEAQDFDRHGSELRSNPM